MDTIFLVKKFKGRLVVDVGRRVVSEGVLRNCSLYEGINWYDWVNEGVCVGLKVLVFGLMMASVQIFSHFMF